MSGGLYSVPKPVARLANPTKTDLINTVALVAFCVFVALVSVWLKVHP